MQIKLWQAILKGCEKRSQCFNVFYKKLANGEVGSCALGAAFEGITGELNTLAHFEIGERFPDLEKINVVTCPVCSRVFKSGSFDVLSLIIHLNDDHRWLRERIALEFVKPIEEKLDDVRADVA